MHGLELIVFALVVVFYIISWIYQTIKRIVLTVRRVVTPSPRVTAETARQQAMEQTRGPTSSQQRVGRQASNRPDAPPRARPEMRARRPEAGGPAVRTPATDAQFRAQVAQIEADESPGLSPDDPAARVIPSLTTGKPLFNESDDLVRAVIMQEILARPLSRRHPRSLKSNDS